MTTFSYMTVVWREKHIKPGSVNGYSQLNKITGIGSELLSLYDVLGLPQTKTHLSDLKRVNPKYDGVLEGRFRYMHTNMLDYLKSKGFNTTGLRMSKIYIDTDNLRDFVLDEFTFNLQMSGQSRYLVAVGLQEIILQGDNTYPELLGAYTLTNDDGMPKYTKHHISSERGDVIEAELQDGTIRHFLALGESKQADYRVLAYRELEGFDKENFAWTKAQSRRRTPMNIQGNDHSWKLFEELEVEKLTLIRP